VVGLSLALILTIISEMMTEEKIIPSFNIFGSPVLVTFRDLEVES
jgi:hypothetical protein